jgi:hypothetical protein
MTTLKQNTAIRGRFRNYKLRSCKRICDVLAILGASPDEFTSSGELTWQGVVRHN